MAGVGERGYHTTIARNNQACACGHTRWSHALQDSRRTWRLVHSGACEAAGCGCLKFRLPKPVPPAAVCAAAGHVWEPVGVGWWLCPRCGAERRAPSTSASGATRAAVAHTTRCDGSTEQE